MNDDPGLEMPSPKRMRLGTPKEEISYDVPPQVDRLDLHWIQLAGVENPKTVPQINAPTQAVPLSSTVHRPIHLPGLKLLNDEPTTSIGVQEPSFGCKVVETATANITSTIDQGQSNSGRAEHAGGPELILEEKLSLEPTTVISTGESEVAESAPSIKGPPEIASPMEDVLPGVVAPERHVAEILGETQIKEGLQEATNRISEVLVQDDIHQDGPPTSEGSHTTNTGPSTDMQAKLESRQEESVTKDVDEDKQEILMEARTVEEQPKTMEPTGSTLEEIAEANKSNAEAEFEIDSSPYASSSSDVSTDSSSSDDSDADDYEMLSPEEEARRLMAEDGGTEEKTTTGVPRTLNEKPDEVVPKPQVTITADMKIEELGRVESLVENLVLIKANTSGEYRVLESGSVLCLEDRSVIGVIAETLGRVQQPYYAVRFSNRAAMEEAGVSQDTKVLYVTQLSTTVITQPLKAFKGSDASNLHDEEVGDDELEFSDDEAEAEHKRQVKVHKRARYDAKHGQENGVGVSQPRLGMPKNLQNGCPNSWPERPPNPAELSLDYDDAGQDSDDLYTPLARPSNLHEMRAREDVPSANHANFGNTNRGGRGKGRGDRGRGGGDRGRGRGRGRGNDRGGRPDRRGQDSLRGIGHPHTHPNTGPQSSPLSQSKGFNASANTNLPPRPPNQSNGSQSHPQNQHLPVQPPFYPAHSSAQPHSHPNHAHQYPSQYPQSYNQPYSQQHQQPHHHYQDPYFQSMPGQGYNPHQAFSPGSQYPIMHIPPLTPSPAAIPPGAHINPNFFRQQAHMSPQPWYHQQGQAFSPAQQYQQYQQPSPANSNAAAPGGIPQEAARRLQENSNMLQGTGPNDSSSR